MKTRRRRTLKFENIESRYLLTAASTVYGHVHVEVNWEARVTHDIDTSIVDVVSNTDGAFLSGVVARQSNLKIIELPMNDVAEIRDTWTNQWDAHRDLLFMDGNALQPFMDMRSNLGNPKLFDAPYFKFNLDVAGETTTNGEFHVTTPSPPLSNQTSTPDNAGRQDIVRTDPPRVELTTPPTDVESIVTQSPPVTTPPIVSPPTIEIPSAGLPLVQDVSSTRSIVPSHQIDLDFLNKFQSESTTLAPLDGFTVDLDVTSSFDITPPPISDAPEIGSVEPTGISLSTAESSNVRTTPPGVESSNLAPIFELSEGTLSEAISIPTQVDIEPPTIVNQADDIQSPLNQLSGEELTITPTSDMTDENSSIVDQQSLMNVADYMDAAHDMTNKVMGVSDESIEMPRETDELIDAEFADRESSEVLRIPSGTDEEFIDVGEISATTDQAMYLPTWFDVAEFGGTPSGQHVVPDYEVGAYSVARPIEFDQTTSSEEPLEDQSAQALPESETKSANAVRISTQFVAAAPQGTQHLAMPNVDADGSSMEMIATSIVTSSTAKNESADRDRDAEESSPEDDGTRYGAVAQATLIAICGATLFYTRDTDRRPKRNETDRGNNRGTPEIA